MNINFSSRWRISRPIGNSHRARVPSLGYSGFTLIEILIVILVLGILAMMVVPQMGTSTQQAKETTLRETLRIVRAGIELYYIQHGNTYPGYKKLDGDGQVIGETATSAEAASSFIRQMLLYTAANGSVSTSKNATYKFGPYGKSESGPVNPFIDNSDTVFDVTTTDITERTSDGTTSWKFYTRTGVWIANDGAHDDY